MSKKITEAATAAAAALQATPVSLRKTHLVPRLHKVLMYPSEHFCRAGTLRCCNSRPKLNCPPPDNVVVIALYILVCVVSGKCGKDPRTRNLRKRCTGSISSSVSWGLCERVRDIQPERKPKGTLSNAMPPTNQSCSTCKGCNWIVPDIHPDQRAVFE